MKKILLVILFLAGSTTANAQFGGLLNDLKNKAEQSVNEVASKTIEKATSQIVPVIPPTSIAPTSAKDNSKLDSNSEVNLPPKSPAATLQAQKERENWIKNPTILDPPPELITNEDLTVMDQKSLNVIISFLNSPKMKAAYDVCKADEYSRIKANVNGMEKEIRARIQSANTVKQRDTVTAELTSLPDDAVIKNSYAPASCIERTVEETAIANEFTKFSEYAPIGTGLLFHTSSDLVSGKFLEKFYANLIIELKNGDLVQRRTKLDKDFQKKMEEIYKEAGASKTLKDNKQTMELMKATRHDLLDKRVLNLINQLLAYKIKG